MATRGANYSPPIQACSSPAGNVLCVLRYPAATHPGPPGCPSSRIRNSLTAWRISAAMDTRLGRNRPVHSMRCVVCVMKVRPPFKFLSLLL